MGTKIDLKEVAILIPAYDAGDTLGEVLGNCIAFGASPKQIWIIDDGSHDNTADVAYSHGVHVLRHFSNQGKGAALKTGFIATLKAGYQWILTMDADRQHDINEVNRFLSNDPSKFDMIIGSRRHNMVGMPFDRWLVNRLTSMVLSLYGGAHQMVTDSQSGYRLISADILKKVRLKTNHFDTESELVARALQAGFRIKEVDITTLYNSPRSHIRPLIDTIRFIKLCLFNLSWK